MPAQLHTSTSLLALRALVWICSPYVAPEAFPNWHTAGKPGRLRCLRSCTPVPACLHSALWSGSVLLTSHGKPFPTGILRANLAAYDACAVAHQYQLACAPRSGLDLFSLRRTGSLSQLAYCGQTWPPTMPAQLHTSISLLALRALVW